MTQKISNINTKSGPIGARLQEEMHSINNGVKLISRIYHSIVRPYPLTDMLKDVSPGDLLIMDFHAEMYPTYYDGADEFGINPGWHQNKSYFPKWLVDKIDSFPTYQADMVSANEARRRKQNTIMACDLLATKFGVNVITIGPVYNKKQYIKELNAVGENLILKDYNFSIPFITMTPDGAEDHINFEYFSRLYDADHRDVRRNKSVWTHIIPDKNMCFSDPDHVYGLHPCHLHPLSMQHLRKPIGDALAKLTGSTTNIII